MSDPGGDRAADHAERTRAVIPVHFAGRPCRIEEIVELAQTRDLAVIEDCAHAIETLVAGRHAGTFGDFGAFSFYVTKNVVTGEGGMVTTKFARLMLRGSSASPCTGSRPTPGTLLGRGLQALRGRGARLQVQHDRPAGGARPPPARVASRRISAAQEIWAEYDAAFAELPVVRPAGGPPGTRHAPPPVHAASRPRSALGEPRRRSPRAPPRENRNRRPLPGSPSSPATTGRVRLSPGRFSERRMDLRRTLSLPLSPKLADEDVESVIAAVKRTLENLAV